MTAVETTTPVSPPVLRRGSRWLAVLILPIGPAAVAVLRFVLPYATVDEPETMVQKVMADPGAESLVLWLAFVAVLTLVPAVLAVGRLTRRRAPVVTSAALLLLVPGYLSLGWLAGGSDLPLWAGAEAGLDAGTVTRMLAAEHPTTSIAAGIFVLGHVVGTVLLGVAMWRSRTVPRWAAVLTVVSQPLHFVAAVILASPSLDLLAWGMNAVGFAAAAVAILRLPDDHWNL
jgi:hypothetical protein